MKKKPKKNWIGQGAALVASAAAPAGAARLPPRPAAARAGSTSPAAGSGLAGLGSAAHHRRRSSGPPPPLQVTASGRAKEADRDRGGRARHRCRRVWREPWPARRWREQGPRRGLRRLRASGAEERKGSRRTALDPAMGKDERRRRWEKGDRGRKRAGEEEGESREWVNACGERRQWGPPCVLVEKN